MTAATGTKRARDALASSQKSLTSSSKSLRLPMVSNHSSHTTRGDEIPKHSNRTRKRTKLTQLRENRRIHRAVDAMADQLASFEKTTHRSEHPEGTSTSFSACSSFFFEVGSQEGSSGKEKPPHQHHESSPSEEYELTTLAQSLRLDESATSFHLGVGDESSSHSNSGGGRTHRHRRRGAISVIVAPKR